MGQAAQEVRCKYRLHHVIGGGGEEKPERNCRVRDRNESNWRRNGKVEPPFPSRCQQKGAKKDGIREPQWGRGGLREVRIPIGNKVRKCEKGERYGLIRTPLPQPRRGQIGV